MTSRISVNPDPPVQGQPVEICYNFSGLSHTDTPIDIDWEPGSGDDESVSIMASQPCITRTVPANATSVVIEDVDGHSSDFASAVAPGAST